VPRSIGSRGVSTSSHARPRCPMSLFAVWEANKESHMVGLVYVDLIARSPSAVSAVHFVGCHSRHAVPVKRNTRGHRVSAALEDAVELDRHWSMIVLVTVRRLHRIFILLSSPCSVRQEKRPVFGSIARYIIPAAILFGGGSRRADPPIHVTPVHFHVGASEINSDWQIFYDASLRNSAASPFNGGIISWRIERYWT